MLPFPEGLYVTVYFTLCKLDTLALGAVLALAGFAGWNWILCPIRARRRDRRRALLLAPMIVIKPDKTGTLGAVLESSKLSIICLMSHY